MPLQRKYYTGGNVERALSIDELREIARRRVPHFAIEYVDCGAEDETTLKWNRAIFESLRFVPGTLVDTTGRSQQASILGKDSNSPIIIAPTALAGIHRHRGDVKLARAAAQSSIPFTQSFFSNSRIEEVAAEAGGRHWMQLYLLKDRGISREVMRRASEAGLEALVVTTDANVFGFREWDRRNYRQPGQLTLRNILDVACHPLWAWDVLIPHGIPQFANVADSLPAEARSASAGVAYLSRLLQPDVTWDDIEWLRREWPHKLVLKGVLNVADSLHAADLGCEGIVISNHGGRQLDGCISPMELLPEIAQALGDRLTVMVDGGFRRGGDVVKALCLGADAVMIGAATLYGLAAGGEAGARHAINILTREIDRTLGQLGCNSIRELGPHLLRPGRTVL